MLKTKKIFLILKKLFTFVKCKIGFANKKTYASRTFLGII